jgi:thymidylate synthase (FAD)
MMVKLIAITQGAGELITKTAQEVISYAARVSSPDNQKNFATAPKLLNYCIRNGHWSPFEMANMILEVSTSRAIAQQILRHRSMSFQEFSGRYSKATSSETYEARRQDVKNRQNSIDDLSQETKDWFKEQQESIWHNSLANYEEALSKGIAKECARFLLPLNTSTKLYINATARSWVHYLQLRTKEDTQKEHRDIALKCREIFVEQFPDISEALGWR